MAKRSKVKKGRAALLIIAALLAIALLVIAAVMLGDLAQKRTYRLDHQEEILASADRYGLDARLIAAVIHTESSNRTAAVSPAGAVGLMQIMPDTAAWIAEKQGREDYAEALLTDPGVNIDMGCWYLSYLLEKYANTRNALAAYNAGPGNVDKWLADTALSDGITLAVIPFSETEEYLVRIDRAYEKYAKLYSDELNK